MARNGRMFGAVAVTTDAQNAERRISSLTGAWKWCTQGHQIQKSQSARRHRIQARKISVSVLMMKRASESGRPEARNFWRASARESARAGEVTAGLARPLKLARGDRVTE